MPKLSQTILERIEERPYQEKLKFAGWRRINVPKQGRPSRLWVKLLVAELKNNLRAKSFPDKLELIPEAEADPYTTRKDGKIYEFWREGDWVKTRISVDLDAPNTGAAGVQVYTDQIKKGALRDYFHRRKRAVTEKVSGDDVKRPKSRAQGIGHGHRSRDS